ncbi:MAG: hypothetical protein J7578_11095 [Chitinophagaceae bacterium]|nr:hypothetical protein [Chitinophagaceae bacterium]
MRVLLLLLLLPVLSAKAQSTFDKKIEAAARTLSCALPDEREPVTLNAMLVNEKDSIAVIVKAALAPGWHIYQYVPQNLPYIPIDHVLQLPKSITAVGGWIKTDPASSANDPGVLIYENEAVFIHKALRIENNGKDTIVAGLYYQTCNLRQCLPPVEKTFNLVPGK